MNEEEGIDNQRWKKKLYFFKDKIALKLALALKDVPISGDLELSFNVLCLRRTGN